MVAVLQPHVKKGKNLEFKFPWETSEEAVKPRKTQAQLKAEFKKIDKNLKDQQTKNG